jgi:hypothetical protein
MALSAKLMMRQGQSLVMTPQLLQAIKLLQFSNIELAGFIEEELERNPMLERVEESGGELPISQAAASEIEIQSSEPDEPRESDWASETLATDGSALEASLGTELNNTFGPDGPAVAPERSTTLASRRRPGPGRSAARPTAKRQTSKRTSPPNPPCTNTCSNSSPLPAPILSTA